jgi:hypothetical protein
MSADSQARPFALETLIEESKRSDMMPASDVRLAARLARKQERERCARIAEEYGETCDDDMDSGVAFEIARRIRGARPAAGKHRFREHDGRCTVCGGTVYSELHY